MSTSHWGEIPKELDNNFVIPNVTADIERSMDKFCLTELKDDSEVLKTEEIVLPPMDPLMLYAISLHKCANDITELIRVAELATESNLIPPKDAAPNIPPMPEIEIKHKRNNLNYMPKDCTPFTCGWDVDIPELSEAVGKKILTKCVATMFAHVGFETTHQSVLDVLTDVLESFFQKFCHKLVVAAEDEEKGNKTGFPHVIEKVLVDTGMGGIKGINDYYQNRVVKYITVLQKRCEQLNSHYALLLSNQASSTTEPNNIVRVKVEDDDDIMEVQNSEVHFSSLDGETSVLQLGYQLLNSLEAEENLQSLGETNEEDVTAGLTGAVSIPPETETWSPFAKKKRFK